MSDNPHLTILRPHKTADPSGNPWSTDMTMNHDTGEWTLTGLIPKHIFTYDIDTGLWEWRGLQGEIWNKGKADSLPQAVDDFRRAISSTAEPMS